MKTSYMVGTTVRAEDSDINDKWLLITRISKGIDTYSSGPLFLAIQYLFSFSLSTVP